MPQFSPQLLRQIGYTIFEACGSSPADAKVVTDHLVESSLFGHDSHGSLRIYEYVYQLDKGVWDPRGTPSVHSDQGCTAVVDGGRAMGQIGGAFAMRLAIDKAREHGTATVALRNSGHLGRVGAYPLMVAREGMIGLAHVNGGRLGYQIAPYGGIDGKLTTNPIAFAAPRRDADPIMIDMATSATAEGKVRLYRNRGKEMPAGWIIDHEGRPSRTPTDFTEEPAGAILPLGGVSAHKGYCLSMMMEVLGGALAGQGCAAGERDLTSNGVLFHVYDIERFTDLDSYYDELEILVGHVRTSRVDPEVGEILIPGEPEFRTARQREREGIEIDQTTWDRIVEAAEFLEIDPATWTKLTGA